MWLQAIRTQKGSATLLALLAMLLLGTSASIYFMSSKTVLTNNDEISAQYAAEAGVIYTLAHAKENTVITTGKWNQASFPSTPVPLDNTAKSPTFTIVLTLISSDTTLSDPTGTLRCAYYKITSLGKAGNTTRSIDAYLTIPLPPTPISTFELMKDADYSGSKWTINDKDPKNPFASAPTDQYYQVLFKDTIYANTGFTLNYNVNLASTNPGHPNDAGYGIYYLASGNAKNMTAYVLQYDPGLSPDQILVKKVIASKNSTTKPWLNEVFGGGTSSFQGSTSRTPQWNDPVTDAKGNQTFSLKNIDPTATSSQDLMTIPMSTVLKQLNNAGINQSNNKMTSQNHKLTIDARPNNNGQIMHTISIDGLQILKFIDRGANGPVLTQGSTGLRVWEADAHFFNNTNEVTQAGAIGSIKIRSWGKEKK